jgi:hypothetical protein
MLQKFQHFALKKEVTTLLPRLKQHFLFKFQPSQDGAIIFIQNNFNALNKNKQIH